MTENVSNTAPRIRLVDEILDHPVKIDLHDRKILYELMINGRKPLSLVAKAVHLSEQVVNYRIKNFLKKGVITKFLTILEISKLKMGVYRAFFRLEKTDSQKEKEIIKHFVENSYVFWLTRISGRWDLFVDFATRDIGHFYEVLQKSINKFPENLTNKEIIAFVDSWHFRRNYLIPGKRDESKIVYFGGVPKHSEVDVVDLQILKKIAEDARLSNIEIGKKLGLAPNTIKNRIRSLEKKKIIQGYSPFIHPTVFGCPCYKILLTVRNTNEEKERKILSFGQYHPAIIFIEKVVGKWDYEYDIECNNEKEFRQLMREMKDQLADVVTDYETITFYYDYKSNYFPWELTEFED